MAIRDVVTAGYGNGTFSGAVAKVVTRGYSVGAAQPASAVCVTGAFDRTETATGEWRQCDG